MIHGIGIDLTEIDRIQGIQARNPHFAEKVLTQAELAVYQQLPVSRQPSYLAGRFSVKEAYVKACGSGLGQVALHAVETLSDTLGKPVLTKHPYAGIAHVSISHTATLVMTEVILEESDETRHVDAES